MIEQSQIPLILVSGFLGSGKTTWLKKVLSCETFGKTAVLVNEFGEIGIDNLIVSTIAPDIVLLDSGCICCQIRGELKEAILEVLTRRYKGEVIPFEQIVIETTGLADPTQIFSTFLMDPVLRNQIKLTQVITIVDSLNGLSLHAQQEEWEPQISAASLILISKTDLTSKEIMDDLSMHIIQLNPTAKIETTKKISCFIESNHQMQDPFFFNKIPKIISSGPKHGKATTLSLSINQEIDWTTFVIWLSALIYVHGNKLLRVKCLLNTVRHGIILLDGVGHTLHPPQHLEKWPSEDKQSRLVFITRHLDVHLIKASFEKYCGN